MLTDSQRSQRARIAAHSLHATHDSRELTKNARRAFRDKFEREADPEGVLSADERTRRATQLRKAFYVRLALASSKARSRKRRPAA